MVGSRVEAEPCVLMRCGPVPVGWWQYYPRLYAKAKLPGYGDIYPQQLEYEVETGDRPWFLGFYRRLEPWAQHNERNEPS